LKKETKLLVKLSVYLAKIMSRTVQVKFRTLRIWSTTDFRRKWNQ